MILIFYISLLLFACAPVFGATTQGVPMDCDSVAQRPCCEISPDHAEVSVETQRILDPILPTVLIGLVKGYHGAYLFPQFLAIHDEVDGSHQLRDYCRSIHIFRAEGEMLAFVRVEVQDRFVGFCSQKPLEELQVSPDANESHVISSIISHKFEHKKMYGIIGHSYNFYSELHAIQKTPPEAVNTLYYLSRLQAKILPTGHAEYQTGVQRSKVMLVGMGLQEFGQRYRNTCAKVALACQSPQFALINYLDKAEGESLVANYEQAKEKATQLESLKPGMGVLFYRKRVEFGMHRPTEMRKLLKRKSCRTCIVS